jgi:hypothetical protein
MFYVAHGSRGNVKQISSQAPRCEACSLARPPGKSMTGRDGCRGRRSRSKINQSSIKWSEVMTCLGHFRDYNGIMIEENMTITSSHKHFPPLGAVIADLYPGSQYCLIPSYPLSSFKRLCRRM